MLKPGSADFARSQLHFGSFKDSFKSTMGFSIPGLPLRVLFGSTIGLPFKCFCTKELGASIAGARCCEP